MKEKFLTVLMIILVSAQYLAVNVRTIKAAGVIYIQADGSINPPEAAISSLDNVTYTLTDNINNSIVIEKSNIVVDGKSYTVQGDGTGNGFTAQNVVNVTIRDTEITGCIEGIQLFNSSSNLLTGNIVGENSYEGIGLYFSSDTNITCNVIRNNQIGIAFYNSSNSLIVHNNIINNTYQVYLEFSTNNWDNGYPSGGNYWNDYNGTDIYSGPGQNLTGSDGIGDMNYTCDENNFDNYPLMNPLINIAIAEVSSSKSSVGEGFKVYINVTVQNQGWNAQTTKLTVYLNSTVLGTVTDLVLPERSQAILNFTWQTTPALRGNYIISSTADPVPNEPDITDNNRAYGQTVKVTVIGDVNGDGAVDIYDAITLSNAFASVPGRPTWNGNADINSDNSVDIYDAILLSLNFNKKI